MAHYQDEYVTSLVTEIAKRRIRNKFPGDIREALGTLERLELLDPGQTREGFQTEQRREERDTAAALVESALEQYLEWEADQPVDHGEILNVTQVGNPTVEGDRIERITYQDGTIEEYVSMSAADAEKVDATMRSRVDRIYDAKADLNQGDQLGILARQTDDAEFRERAKAVRQRGQDALDSVRNEIVEELRGKGFSEPDIADELRKSWEVYYDPLYDGVPEALELARAGKVTELYDHIAGDGTDEKPELTPTAKEQLMEKLDLDPELAPIGDQLLEIESERIEARARFAREAGLV